MSKEVVHTEKAGVTGAPLVQAMNLGNLIFCSGASPRHPKRGNKVVEGSFNAQATQALANLKAVLESSGSGFEYCLKATCYLLNIDERPVAPQWSLGCSILERISQPARTVVAVAKASGELPARDRGYCLRSVVKAKNKIVCTENSMRHGRKDQTATSDELGSIS